VSPYLVQRDPRWWSEPDEFRPSRFTGPLSREQRAAYLPFGAGLRQCIGRDFALWEVTRVLSGLSDHFRWEPALPLPTTNASVTLRPQGGMQVRIRQLNDRR
jgi:cytochrome P450